MFVGGAGAGGDDGAAPSQRVPLRRRLAASAALFGDRFHQDEVYNKTFLLYSVVGGTSSVCLPLPAERRKAKIGALDSEEYFDCTHNVSVCMYSYS